MRKYSFLPHKCDIKMKVEADSLRDLFGAALEGLNHVIKENRSQLFGEKRELLVDIEAVDVTALIIDFLAEVLAETHTEYAVFDKLSVLELDERHLKAILRGCKIEGFDEDVKAVTYHEADVRINGEGYYQCVIVLDI